MPDADLRNDLEELAAFTEKVRVVAGLNNVAVVTLIGAVTRMLIKKGVVTAADVTQCMEEADFVLREGTVGDHTQMMQIITRFALSQT
ncbi:hypothetical protein [Nitrospirillum bahiense]|uniref:Uncharacterized protein n=1 Tax=Nitrospirillum amazonense TaxID=28077 RepID=A0A560F1Z6_9PROT|nr:hypothetical protein [Nitrospirillum amazonense]TWB15617.1 hypothetical protein FBZ88_12970 [Nitrospirillum amazonense]